MGIDGSLLLLCLGDVAEVPVVQAFDRFLVNSPLELAICCPP